MGISILEMVLQRLREQNFVADVAYPGQMFPQITEPVAAVHIEKVDRSNLTVTLEVNIICPAALGGTTCELEALRATAVLGWEGAVCVQNGCIYDGIAQVYTVSILATFTCLTDAEDCAMGPGFEIYIDGTRMPYVVAFTAERECDHRACHEMGESVPVAVSEGSCIWHLTMEEVIPADATTDTYFPTDDVTVKRQGPIRYDIYYDCWWTSVKWAYTKQGLRRIHTGFALSREGK